MQLIAIATSVDHLLEFVTEYRFLRPGRCSHLVNPVIDTLLRTIHFKWRRVRGLVDPWWSARGGKGTSRLALKGFKDFLVFFGETWRRGAGAKGA